MKFCGQVYAVSLLMAFVLYGPTAISMPQDEPPPPPPWMEQPWDHFEWYWWNYPQVGFGDAKIGVQLECKPSPEKDVLHVWCRIGGGPTGANSHKWKPWMMVEAGDTYTDPETGLEMEATGPTKVYLDEWPVYMAADPPDKIHFTVEIQDKRTCYRIGVDHWINFGQGTWMEVDDDWTVDLCCNQFNPALYRPWWW